LILIVLFTFSLHFKPVQFTEAPLVHSLIVIRLRNDRKLSKHISMHYSSNVTCKKKWLGATNARQVFIPCAPIVRKVGPSQSAFSIHWSA